MATCAKCSNDVKKVYDCEHTNFEEYCVECYTELHYYLTEKNWEYLFLHRDYNLFLRKMKEPIQYLKHLKRSTWWKIYRILEQTMKLLGFEMYLKDLEKN